MLKRYKILTRDDITEFNELSEKFDDGREYLLQESKNGNIIKYSKYLLEKQSEKEELKKKVEEIIITAKNRFDFPTNLNAGQNGFYYLIEQLKSLIGE